MKRDPYLKHDSKDRCTCSYCGIKEDIHLLDGVLTENGDDSGLLSCIRCYPKGGNWNAMAYRHVRLSIAPELKPFYREWIANELAKAERAGDRAYVRAELIDTLRHLN